jgi:hypothetical protein
MEGILEKDSPLLNQLKSYEIKFSFLIAMIEQDVLREDEKVLADSNRLFEIASDIINTYLYIVDKGISLIEEWHNNEIENRLSPSMTTA